MKKNTHEKNRSRKDKKRGKFEPKLKTKPERDFVGIRVLSVYHGDHPKQEK